MSCMKCGSPTQDGELLCEKCSAERNGSPFQSDEKTVPPLKITKDNDTGTNKPPKKRFNKVVITFISVFVLLIGIVSVGKLCFNRDFTELLMGKTKYAQNIELNTAKSTAGQMVAAIDKTVNFAKGTGKNMTSDSTFQFNVKAEDQLLKAMGLAESESAAFQQTVKYINSLKMDVKSSADEKGVQTNLVISDPSALKLTADVSAYKDGKVYLHLPELLDKYISIGDQATSQFNLNSLQNLKYDPVKLKASLEKLAVIYSDTLSTAEVKAENDQSITIDGTAVKGQKLTASLTAAQTTAMFKAIGQAAKNDSDLYAFVSDNYSLFSAMVGKTGDAASEKLTKESYGKLIDDLLTNLRLDKDEAAFSTASYLSQNGTLLAHCYNLKDKTDDVRINYLISDGKNVIEIFNSKNDGFTFSNTKTGEGAGKMQLKLKFTEQSMNFGLNVDYSAVKTVKFAGSDINTGKYIITLLDPDHTISNYVKEAGLPASFDKLDQSALTIEQTPDGESMKSSVQLTLPELLSVSVSGKTSGKAGSAAVQAAPEQSQVVNLGSQDSTESLNKLSLNGMKYLSGTLEKDPELAAVLAGFGLTKEQLDALLVYSQG